MDSQLHPTSSSSRSRFRCTNPGCDRRYSRLEHLQRHQLNHNPGDVYRCDYPACKRSFVRRDLLTRHRERHDNPARTGPLRQACNREDWVSYSTGSSYPPEPTLSMVTHQSSKSTDAAPYEPRLEQIGVELTATDIRQDGDGSHDTRVRLETRHPEVFGNEHANVNRFEELGWSFDVEAQAPSIPDYVTGEGLGAQPNGIDGSIPSAGDEFATWLFDDMERLQTAPSSAAGLVNLPLFNGAYLDPTLDFLSLQNHQAVGSSLPVQDQYGINNERALVSASIYDDSISLRRWKSLANLLTSNFTYGSAEQDEKYSNIFQSNVNREEHVLSWSSVQRYLDAYWTHFHSQLPFLHRATFSAETAHDYLLLGIIVIGSTHIEGANGTAPNRTTSDLADFIAWNLRRRLFLHDDFEPPAKLWLLQSLLLLETYEYLSSSRKLHERSHIHHSTMINLMRRGVAFNEAAILRSKQSDTLSEWWTQWIAAEETRRVAFAVFMLDTLYATMFGHTAALAAHEVKLALPCNDILWAASSAEEVARLEVTLQASGVKPTALLEALRQTLLGHKVTTDHFGRIILMSGLLSVTWQMEQRDAQVATLSAPPMTHPAADGWRLHLSKAYEFWKNEFDDSIEQRRMLYLPVSEMTNRLETMTLAESAEMLYHTSLMTMHADVVDCEVFAGATRVLGQDISRTDFAKVQSRISNWAEGESTKLSVFHAVRLLAAAVPSPETGTENVPVQGHGHLLFRPWALYCAALVLWSYCVAGRDPRNISLASDGPRETTTGADMATRQEPSPAESETALRTAQAFVQAAKSIKSPEDIDSGQIGSENVAAVLMYLECTFRGSPWELLREAADRLRHAAQGTS